MLPNETLSYRISTSSLITSVAISPDGKRIAVGNVLYTVVLYNATVGQQLLTLAGHFKEVDSVAFSPDGRWVASGSRDSTIRVWDASSGQQQRLMNAGSVVNSVAYSPDGKTLACGCALLDGSVQLWNAENGTQVWKETGHTSHVWSVAFSPDGQTVASGSDDTTVRAVVGGCRWPAAAHDCRAHQRCAQPGLLTQRAAAGQRNPLQHRDSVASHHGREGPHAAGGKHPYAWGAPHLGGQRGL